MLTGENFRLKVTTLAVENLLERRVAVDVPAGETITVLSGPTPEVGRMVDVRWGRRPLIMFASDSLERRQEVGNRAKA
jgi:hypothetical protein